MSAVLNHDRSDIASVLSASSLRYSQVWEDSATARAALLVRENDNVVSICSAGCNVLALLLSRPRRIVAVDLNPAQAALLNLKLAALASLDHAEFASLLGAGPHPDRVALYERTRRRLAESARDYWDAHHTDISAGILGSGRLEQYFRAFQKQELHRPDRLNLIRELIHTSDLDEQRASFQALESTGLRAPFVAYFSRESMAREGRHAAQFAHVDVHDVGEWFWERFRFACTQLPTRGNWYLEWFLCSSYGDLNAGPWYLRPENHERLRSLADRVTVVTGDVMQLLTDEPRQHDKINFSDVFEYLSPQQTTEALAVAATALKPGGRICYWNLLVERQCPPELSDRIRQLRDLGDTLWKRDRSWFYRAVRVEEVIA